MKTGIRLTTGILAGILLTQNVRAQTLKEPVIESRAAVVMDMDSGDNLYEKNGQEKLYPASIVKILTALVTAERGNLNDTVVFSYDAVYGVEEGSGNALQLETGDSLTVEECMYAMLLKSSNQAANALAEYIAGSNEKFAEYMNEEAEELGCTDSHFVNPSGLNAETQKVTAEDMAKIASAALGNDIVKTIASAKIYQLPATINNPDGCTVEMEHQLVNENGTDYKYKYAYAGKTGYTEAAGNTLVTAAEKDGKNLVAVVLKSNMTHYTDTIRLFNYGFAYLDDLAEEKTAEEETENTETSRATAENQEQNEDAQKSFVSIGKGIILLILLYLAALLFRRHKSRLRKKRKNIRKASESSKKRRKK